MSDAPKRPRRWITFLVRFLVVVILLGGAAGGYWWWQQNAAAQAATPGEAEHEPASEHGDKNAGALLAFEPFLVNLSGNGGSQFLRTKVQLVLADDARVKEIEEQPVALMRLRSTILEILAEQTAEALVTAEGKAALRKSIQERAGGIAGTTILDVLFADFVVQF